MAAIFIFIFFPSSISSGYAISGAGMSPEHVHTQGPFITAHVSGFCSLCRKGDFSDPLSPSAAGGEGGQGGRWRTIKKTV